MASVVTAFFDAYSAMDFAAMSAMMHPDFTFSDPPFGQLDTRDSRNMFRMFTANSPKSHLTITATSPSSCSSTPTSDIQDAETYTLLYTCDYLFAPGRQVHNEITSVIQVVDGKVAAQHDECDMQKWAPQALGPVLGTIIKWVPGGMGLVRSMAKKRLAEWVGKHPE